MLRLPIKVIKDILRHLFVSPSPLILHRDAYTPANYRSQLQPSVLRVCQLSNHVGPPSLRKHTYQLAPTPAKSINFDAHTSELVEGLKALRVFRLEGYTRHEAFARGLGEFHNGRN